MCLSNAPMCKSLAVVPFIEPAQTTTTRTMRFAHKYISAMDKKNFATRICQRTLGARGRESSEMPGEPPPESTSYVVAKSLCSVQRWLWTGFEWVFVFLYVWVWLCANKAWSNYLIMSVSRSGKRSIRAAKIVQWRIQSIILFKYKKELFIQYSVHSNRQTNLLKL